MEIVNKCSFNLDIFLQLDPKSIILVERTRDEINFNFNYTFNLNSS